jgi:hypothetical protein
LAGLKGAAPSIERIVVSLDAVASRVHPDTPKRPPAALRLLAELYRRATPDSVTVSRAELAQSLAVSERTIQRASRALVVADLIAVTGDPNDRYAPNTYRVRLQPPHRGGMCAFSSVWNRF